MPTMHEDDKLFQFARGLANSIKTHVNVQHPKTLVQAMQMAVAAEQGVEAAADPPGRFVVPSAVNAEPMDLGMLGAEQRLAVAQAELAFIKETLAAAGDSWDCHKCGVSGHSWRRCPQWKLEGKSVPRVFFKK